MMKDTGNVALASMRYKLLKELKTINDKLKTAEKAQDNSDYDKYKYKRDLIIDMLFDMANTELREMYHNE